MTDTAIPSPRQAAKQIASTLGETQPAALAQIRSLIQVMGIDFTQALLEETQEIERNGGMLLPKYNRRRTSGGVFFTLAKQKLTPDQQEAVFTPVKKSPLPQADTPANLAPVVKMKISAEARQAAADIAAQLQEVDPEKLTSIARVIDVGGIELAQDALATTLEMESQGGIRKQDGARRPPGEAFLYIASRRLSEEQRQQVWPTLPDELLPPVKKVSSSLPTAAAAAKPPAPAGTATTAKMTLVGRPASIDTRQGFVEFRLESGKAPNLPKGLPTPQSGSVFTVYVAHKQWAKVAATVQNPLDALIIEGYPMVDAKNGRVVLLATNVISKLAKQTQKPAQVE